MIPVGGYVRMAGEIGEGDDGPSEGSLARKSPLQRIFVYSAGVLMNFIIAFIIFPIVYFWGLPAPRPIVASVAAGSPAWHARVVPGSVIRSINGQKIDSFDQIPIEVAVAASPITVEFDEPIPGKPGEFRSRTEKIATDYHEERGVPWLGIEGGTFQSQIVTMSDGTKRWGPVLTVRENTPAHEAGLRDGDVLVALDGKPVDALFLRVLAEKTIDPAQPVKLQFMPGVNSPRRDSAELAKITNPDGIALTPKALKDTERHVLGVGLARDVVKGVRHSTTLDALGLKTGDQILSVNGNRISQAGDFQRATSTAQEINITFLRDKEKREARLKLDDATIAEVQDGIAFVEGENSTRVYTRKNSPAERAGIQDGDRIVKINETVIPNWETLQKVVRDSKGGALAIEVEREKGAQVELQKFTVTPTTTSEFDFGFHFMEDRTPVRAENLADAFRLGFNASTRFIKQILIFLKKIALGQVAANKNVAGPILLAATTYQVASDGFVHLLYFLAVLSLNLALVNLLPIPLLDGGNLFFVIVEAIKGSPVSDRVIGASQSVGIFLLITLMVWVTFHDVRRVFSGFF